MCGHVLVGAEEALQYIGIKKVSSSFRFDFCCMYISKSGSRKHCKTAALATYC